MMSTTTWRTDFEGEALQGFFCSVSTISRWPGMIPDG